MHTEVRIVGGTFRTRKIVCESTAQLRPTPHRVREALFNIWADDIADRPFVDLFAGTGVNGFEALSRGASSVLFVERDRRLVRDLSKHIKQFDVQDLAETSKADVYRWVRNWTPSPEPVNIFVSPPFADLQKRTDGLLSLLEQLQTKCVVGSMIVVQSEDHSELDGRIDLEEWQQRRYGRNVLLLWRAPTENTSR